MSLGTILIIVLVLLLLGVIPSWGIQFLMGIWTKRGHWHNSGDSGDSGFVGKNSLGKGGIAQVGRSNGDRLEF